MSHVEHVCSKWCVDCKADDPNGACKNASDCRCDGDNNARILVTKKLYDLALRNNQNYDSFTTRFYKAMLLKKCWPSQV